MHEPYDEYEDDDYNDDYNYDDSYDYNSKFYFKFDNNAWIDWLEQAMKDLVEYPKGTWSFYLPSSLFPVNVDPSKAGGKKSSHLFLGINSFKEDVWKPKYFAVNDGNIKYMKHLESNAVYFLNEPLYYKGLFNIMN